MKSNFQEYKCPKCSAWDDGFPIKDGRITCNYCAYIGELKEFEAKGYSCYVQVIVKVIAFDEEDAKKEFEMSFKKDLEPYFDELIKIEEE